MSIPIGEKIRTIRENLGMGRAEFSRKTGIPKETIIGTELRGSEPRAGILIAIATQWPEYAAYLLTDETEVTQKNPEVEKLARELPKASAG